VLSRAVTPKRKGRNWLTALAALSILTGTLVFSSTGLALTQSEFELDKNATNDLTTVHLGSSKSAIKSTAATNSFINCEIVGVIYPAPPFTILVDSEVMTVDSFGATTTTTGGCSFSDPALVASGTRVYNVTRLARAAHPGGSDVTQLITGAADGDDWDQVYASITADANDTGADDQCLALGAVECAWIHDGFDVSVFTGGSKDDLDLDQWGHTDSSVPPSDEILDAFAAKYDDGTRELLFFGADRWSTNGAKDFGFWFFKNEVVAEPDGTFGDALHAVGDILILGTFSQGGAVATIRVFSWAGLGLGDTNGVLNTEGNFGDCLPGGGTGPGCNTVNDTTIPSPWAYQGAGSTQVPGVIYSGGFIEGGIDLTELGLTGCFSSFVAETRSSPSISAQLKDMVLGSFESCEASITTEITDDDGIIASGDSISDTATVHVTGPAPIGDVDFYLCGPEDDIATCDATGTFVSSEDLAGATVSGDDYTVTSDSVTPTEPGDYCFYAEYPASQDDNYPDGAFPIDSANECFTVELFQPELSTTQTVTIKDEATITVSGGGNLDGTAHFQPFSDSSCTAGNELAAVQDVDVAGASPKTVGTTPMTIVDPGEPTIYWQVSYTSDNASQSDIAATCTENASIDIND